MNKEQQDAIRTALQHSAKLSLGDPLEFVQAKFKQAHGGTSGALRNFRLAIKDHRTGACRERLTKSLFKFALAQCGVVRRGKVAGRRGVGHAERRGHRAWEGGALAADARRKSPEVAVADWKYWNYWTPAHSHARGPRGCADSQQ